MTMNDLKDIFQSTANQLVEKAPIPEEFKGHTKDLITNGRQFLDQIAIGTKPNRPSAIGVKPSRPDAIGIKPSPQIQQPQQKLSGWQKFKNGFGKFWKVIGKPFKGIINTVLPGSGAAIDAIEQIRRK
ncbi:Hypothetical_protein [Hexamita inflata]|uniref:Hypothetical_protein n=1 Tax=Hexamita inflata TaxID=28002 RepID=A0AA86P586_9EUKA|nr:Hypothetical protein HINF_LOCUS18728 [Hexamita inflata]